MAWLGTIFLYLHVAGVIVAFGPSIAFPLFAAKAAKEPQHGNFVLRTMAFIQSRLSGAGRGIRRPDGRGPDSSRAATTR